MMTHDQKQRHLCLRPAIMHNHAGLCQSRRGVDKSCRKNAFDRINMMTHDFQPSTWLENAALQSLAQRDVLKRGLRPHNQTQTTAGTGLVPNPKCVGRQRISSGILQQTPGSAYIQARRNTPRICRTVWPQTTAFVTYTAATTCVIMRPDDQHHTASTTQCLLIFGLPKHLIDFSATFYYSLATIVFIDIGCAHGTQYQTLHFITTIRS
jgi:hypothetical protein